MSISPIDAIRSESSPPSPNPQTTPTSEHGFQLRGHLLDLHHIGKTANPSARDGNSLAEVGSASGVSGDSSVESSGSTVAASGASCDSSKNDVEVEHQNPDGKNSSNGQNSGTSSQYHSTVHGGISSQFRSSDQLGPQINEKPSGTGKYLRSDHLSPCSNGLQSTGAQPASRRNQVVNANHLLNFYYDPISRPPPRGPPPRRQRKMKPYNKDLFLQANYKFVVLDTGNYQIGSMDPDKMLQWEDIICVRYSTTFPVQCPICLESPLCPQITSCGHIYCFPCILRYLLMGEEDHRGDCWKKCPLCVMMISSKDLFTISIENVNQFHVGDRAQFTLLTRPKDSLVPSLKNHQPLSPMSSSCDDIQDLFSKFTLTSDVELSVREAKSDLNSWLHKAEMGVVEDLEKLPYVCAALEQLDERMKNWMEHWTFSGSPPQRNNASPSSNLKVTRIANKPVPIALTTNGNSGISTGLKSGAKTFESGLKHELSELSAKMTDESSATPLSAEPEYSRSPEKAMSACDEHKSFQSSCKDVKERDSYAFYQATDGQHLILHPLNMKCLLHHYGNYDMLPPSVSGKILEMEVVTQTEAMRRRYRYLSHFSLTTTFQLCEIDLSESLPPCSLAPFKDEIKKREKQRKQLARKEQDEKARAEAAALHVNPVPYDHQRLSCHKDAMFSSDDFEALGTVAVPSSSPPINNERKSFSSVTRLGFAAAHDSPSLKAEGLSESSGSMEKAGEASSTQGLTRPMTTMSFANIMSTPKTIGIPAPQTSSNGLGKKGKKPTKVLLSTAGGRRY